MSFDCEGPVEFVELQPEDICGEIKTQNLLISHAMTFQKAKDTCSLMKKAIITEYKNMQDFDSFSSLEQYKNCKYVWTPYSGKPFFFK